MKGNLNYLGILFFAGLTLLFSCSSKNNTANQLNKLDPISPKEQATFDQKEGDTIHISNEEATYDIIIIEPGFDLWLSTIARPRNFYSQSFLENRNRIYVQAWNNRVSNPQFNQNLYELLIDYNWNTDYGYEVNYKLYNYFIFFQRKYNQRLSGILPRI
ncbi:MAG: DUF6146 family protein [Flavobacteriaceae bacterium]|nr:DUF6146 family protein [Flavobacteriaceae bacterium]